MSSSLILQRFSELLNSKKVLTHPQELLGFHTEKVLEFWKRVENLTQEQLEVVNERYDAFFNETFLEWRRATDLAIAASREVVDVNYAYPAGWAAGDVTKSEAAEWATEELIGGVENPTFIPMFDDLEKPLMLQGFDFPHSRS